MDCERRVRWAPVPGACVYRWLPTRHVLAQTVRRPYLRGWIADFWHRLLRIGFFHGTVDAVGQPAARYTGCVSENGFYRFGRLAGVKFRKAKWMWQSATGSEADAIRAEYGVGRDMAAVILEQTPSGADEEVQALLDRTGQELAASVRNRLHRFQITSVEEDHPTAFALPGGFIFVARSLVELCDKDRNEIAFVLAHEMAHVIRRHAIDRLLTQKVMSAASLASPGRGALTSWIRKVGFQWLERAYSQDQEFEADELGMLLMRAAGFDSTGGIRLLERLGGLDQTPDPLGLGPYLSTHPSVEERVLKLRRLTIKN